MLLDLWPALRSEEDEASAGAPIAVLTRRTQASVEVSWEVLVSLDARVDLAWSRSPSLERAVAWRVDDEGELLILLDLI